MLRIYIRFLGFDEQLVDVSESYDLNTCFKILLRLIETYCLMMNTAVFLKTLYLWGKLTIIACFTEFHSVWVVLSTVDQPVSICKLIFGFWKVQRFCAPYILIVL